MIHKRLFKTLSLISLLLVLSKGAGAQLTRKFVNYDFRNNVELRIQFRDDSLFNGSLVFMKKQGNVVDKKTDFSGSREPGSLQVRFSKKPPSLNENLRWSMRSWQIINVDRVDTIRVVFLEREPGTKKWKEAEHEFIESFE